MEDEVINIAKAIRPDIIFVRNPSFKKLQHCRVSILQQKSGRKMHHMMGIQYLMRKIL